MPAQPDIAFERDLWEAAADLRGTVAPADYKHYVLPLLLLRYLSLRYQQRYRQLQAELKEPSSAYYTGHPTIDNRTGQPVPANIYANGALLYQHVISFQVIVPLTAATELTVTAPGYQPWSAPLPRCA